VVDGAQEVENLALYNGQRSVLLSVQKAQDENTIAVVDRLGKALAEMEKELPPGVRLVAITDGSRQIRVSVDNVRRTLIEGAALTVLIVFLFLELLALHGHHRPDPADCVDWHLLVHARCSASPST